MRAVASRIMSVDDAEHFARKRLPKIVAELISESSDQGITAAANIEAFRQVGFRPRAAVFHPERSTGTTVLGHRISMPVIISSVGRIRTHHTSGEPAVARAAGAAGTIQFVSCLTGYSIEDVCAAATGPIFLQLYLPGGRENAEKMIERAGAAGCAGLVVTVDLPNVSEKVSFVPDDGTVRDTKAPLPDRVDVRTALRFFPKVATKPAWLFDFVRDGMQIDTPMWLREDGKAHTLYESVASMFEVAPVWNDVRWIRDAWSGPLVVKGITRVEDARRAEAEGASAIVVSNHGGKALDGAPATLRVLAEIVDAVGDEVEVLTDGGIRRGSDVVKAVALGARAVGIGRAYLWPHAAAGEVGVRRILEVFRTEIDRTLALLGCPSIEALDESYVSVPAEWRTSSDALV